MVCMTLPQSNEPTLRKPLRLWPGVLDAVLLLLFWFVVPVVVPDAAALGVIGGLVCALVVVLWWAFFSRAPHLERWGAILLMIVAMAATRPILHPSIRGGMMGMMFLAFALPTLSLALVAWAAATRRLSDGPRRAWLVAAILFA